MMMMTVMVTLSALGVFSLEMYVSLFIGCYFSSVMLFQPKKKPFGVLGISLILVFALIVLKKVLEIINIYQ